MPELVDGTQLCLMHLNNATIRSSLDTAWPSQPVGQNSSDSDSRSNRQRCFSKRQQQQKHLIFFCWVNCGLTRCHFMLHNDFREGRLSGHIVNSAISSCLWKEQNLCSRHRKVQDIWEKEHQKTVCWNWKSCKFIPQTAFSKEANSFAVPSTQLLRGKLSGKKKLLLIIQLQSFATP